MKYYLFILFENLKKKLFKTIKRLFIDIFEKDLFEKKQNLCGEKRFPSV